jgi:hypothetical protein
MVRVVQICYSCAERLDASRRAILSRVDRDVQCMWSLEAAFDIVFDFWGTLA